MGGKPAWKSGCQGFRELCSRLLHLTRLHAAARNTAAASQPAQAQCKAEQRGRWRVRRVDHAGEYPMLAVSRVGGPHPPAHAALSSPCRPSWPPSAAAAQPHEQRPLLRSVASAWGAWGAWGTWGRGTSKAACLMPRSQFLGLLHPTALAGPGRPPPPPPPPGAAPGRARARPPPGCCRMRPAGGGTGQGAGGS